jgi:hypothetical protein
MENIHDIDVVCETPQDRAILMCIDRIAKLEEHIVNLEREMKACYIRDILVLDVKSNIAIDLFAYICGVTPIERVDINCHKLVYKFEQIIQSREDRMPPKRALELFAYMKHSKAPWSEEFHVECKEYAGNLPLDYGANVYDVLQAMTIDEIRGYLDYRLRWTMCKC